MKPKDLVRLRLSNQHLAMNPRASPEDVVSWFGAMQSQELALAKWSIGQRLAESAGEADVDRALAEGKILRTHAMRPTWHFVQAADLRWILALTSPRVHAVNAHYYQKVGLDAALFRKSASILSKELKGGRHRTRTQLAERFAERKIEADGMRLAYLMMHAELEALITSGAPEGKQQTYALVEERIPKASPWPRDQALAELVRRYFSSHGPATAKDFSWWSGLTLADTKRGLDIIAAEVERSEVEGRTYWIMRDSAPAAELDAPLAHLLQVYDEYVIAYSESRDLLNLAGIELRSEALLHVAVIDGQLAGYWRRKGAAIETELRQPLRGKKLSAFERARERQMRFFTAPREGSPASPRRRR